MIGPMVEYKQSTTSDSQDAEVRVQDSKSPSPTLHIVYTVAVYRTDRKEMGEGRHVGHSQGMSINE